MKYHVGCGIIGIFAGKLNKAGTMWLDKSDVTAEAIDSVAQFLLEHDESVLFTYHGKRYRLSVKEEGGEE